ncbi:MAG: hypothetical protein H3C47_16370 [Candidatus Cloacimonetes bacterium]|nr:hypothetical protein [Candidatus Cloacimonadota bacterium]
MSLFLLFALMYEVSANSRFILKGSYQNISDNSLGQRMDLHGFNLMSEIPLSPVNGGLLSIFSNYSRLNLGQKSLFGLPVSGNANIYGAGLKYNFSGKVKREMSRSEALDQLFTNPSIYMKLGFEHVQSSSAAGFFPIVITDSSNSNGAVYGAGAEIPVSNQFGLFLEWQNHTAVDLDNSSFKFGASIKL